MFEDVGPVSVSEQELREIFENLFSNAIDAMEEGGALTIEVSEENVKGEPHVVVKVRDTGKGIPEDKLETIFEPFFSTKVKKKGTGLGLPIVKKIMEDHNGYIKAESALSVGTTFSLFFPLKNNTKHF